MNEMKRTNTIFCCLLLALAASCTRDAVDTVPPLSGKVDPIAVWRAPDSSVEERAQAVNGLILKGTSIREAKQLLGETGKWHRFHGPSVQINTDGTSTDLGYVERWTYVYKFPDGWVELEILNPKSNISAHFSSASYHPPPEVMPFPTNKTRNSANNQMQNIGTNAPNSDL